MQLRGIFVLLLLSMVIVEETLAWKWAKKAIGKVAGWYGKHKHWVNPLVGGLAGLWDNLARLRDEDEPQYNQFMENLEKDLREQFDQEIADDVVRGMDEFLDITSDSASDVMEEIAQRSKHHDAQDGWESVGQVIASHLDRLK